MLVAQEMLASIGRAPSRIAADMVSARSKPESASALRIGSGLAVPTGIARMDALVMDHVNGSKVPASVLQDGASQTVPSERAPRSVQDEVDAIPQMESAHAMVITGVWDVRKSVQASAQAMVSVIKRQGSVSVQGASSGANANTVRARTTVTGRGTAT